MASTEQAVEPLGLALKEWAVTVRALERGDQVVVLRKGGIAEKRQRFEPRAARFLLFPTYEHQDPASLRPAYHGLLEETLAYPAKETRVPLSSWAQLVAAFRASDLKSLLELSDAYVWSEEEVRDRWAWKPERPLLLLALRVHRLPEVREIELRRQYGGCRSWVELHEPVDVAGSGPVLADEAFAERMERIATHPGG